MANNSINIMKGLNKSTPKRKQAPSTSLESDSSPAIKQNSKRTYHELSDSFQEEEGQDNMAIQETLHEIKRQFETLARWEDTRQLKDEVDKLSEKMSERMDKLDSRCFDIEKGMDSMKEEFGLMKKENADLEEQLQHQEQRVSNILSNQNDLEQYDCRWNLTVQRAGKDGGDTRQLRQNMLPDIYWGDQGSGQGRGSGSSTSDWTGGGRQKVDHHCVIPVKETLGQGARRQEETKREKGVSWWRPDTSQW